MSFIDLGIFPKISALLEERNITTPTAIQSLVIPRILEGQSVVAKSQTGSGKSLAYLLPLLQNVESQGDTQLLILAPTRELAQQIGEVARWLSEPLSLRVAVVFGGVKYEIQQELFATQPDVVVATPGRLQDIISQGIAQIENLKYFVLDEADQMVDMGFREPILQLAELCHVSAQRLFFSATLPEAVMGVISQISECAELVEDKSQPLAAQSITQSAYWVEQSMMSQLMLHLLRTLKPTCSILFCRSRKMADVLNFTLTESGFASEVIHSECSQAAREYILGRFKSGETSVLVATDLMARGVDVEGVTHVFNFGLPQNTEQYIHRIGRTGRAGKSGVAISLICPDEKSLFDATCVKMRQPIPASTTHPYTTLSLVRALSEDKRAKKNSKKRGKR